MRSPNFRSLVPTVQPAEPKKTDTHTDTTENINSSANAGGNNHSLSTKNES